MPSASGIRAGKAYVELSVQEKNVVSKIQNRLADISSRLDAFSKNAAQKIADVFVIGAPVAAATKLFANFDDQMRIVAAVSGATGKAFEQLTDKALELGRTTSFTASQVAEGMAGLGRAGFRSNEIENSIASVMALSKATATDLAVATDIAGNALRAFGLNTEDMTRVCDVLTVTANGSAQTVEDLGEALKFVAPIAAQTGMTLEDTAKVLGTLANFGIKGSNAGTAFKNMRTKMAEGTVQEKYRSIGVETVDKDTGALRNMSDVLNDLRVAVQDMPDAERLDLFKELFGMYGLAGGSVLATAEGFDELYKSIDNAAGAAEKTQAAMEAGLGGAIRSTLSACEGLAIAVGDAVAPAVQELGETVKRVTASLTEFVGQHKGMVSWLTKSGAKMLAFGVGALVAARAAARLIATLRAVVAVGRSIGVAFGFITGATKAYAAAQAAANAVSVASKSVEAAKLAVVSATAPAEMAAATATLQAAMAEEAQAIAASKAASALLAQKIALAGVCVAAVGLAAVAAGIAYVTATAEKGADKARELVQATEQRAQANEQARQKDAELFQELQNLADQSELTNEEFARGKSIVDQLTSKYGDLGISIDDVAKKFGIATDAKDKFDAKMREAQRKDVEAQIKELENANAEIDKSIKKYTGEGFSNFMAQSGRTISSWFGGDSLEERVDSLGNERMANSTKLSSLRQQLEGLKDLDEAVKQDAEDVANGKNVLATREAETTSSEFAQRRGEELGKYEAQRAPIKKEFEDYLAAQKTILDAALANAKTEADREAAQSKYNANVESATGWYNRTVGAINAEEGRANSESARTAGLADAQSRLLSAKLASIANPSDDNMKALADAANALKEVEKENAQSRAQEAMTRLVDAANALKAAQEGGAKAQIEAAQKELADAQQEAANASSALQDIVSEPLKEIASTGTFDAFEAFDMTNDWEKEAMEKQTEALTSINETLKLVKKNQEDAVRDENGVVII